MFPDVLKQASIVALLSIVVAMLPLGTGIAYAIRPTEQRLALMRPVSLAGIFAALCGLVLGLVNVLRFIAVGEAPVEYRIVMLGIAEALIPLFVAFGALTVAWLCVAIGVRRHS